MNNFWARTITGLSMVFILVVALLFSREAFSLFFFAVTILGLREFFTITASGNLNPQRIYGTVSGGLVYAGIALPTFLTGSGYQGYGWTTILYLVPVPVLVFSLVLELFRNRPQPLLNTAITVFGILYIAFPLAILSVLNGEQVLRVHNFPVFLTGYLVLTWTYDTVAYLYGKAFGKHKLFERISPKKTWEGTIAGVTVSIFASVALYYLAGDVTLFDWFMILLIVLAFGTFGDLFESLIKRSLELKDSGSVLPGHGGILDRFDTILLSAPFVFLYLVVRNLLIHG